jgi:transcriptional repressor NrdR
MRCPFCHKVETKVIDSRNLEGGFSIRRRRRCEDCQRRFTTYEHLEIHMPHIIKRDGRREQYLREKISGGLKKACEKRPIPTLELERTIQEVERQIFELNEKEVSSLKVGELIMKQLRSLDPVAYIRFASVYRKFQDIDEFVSEIKSDITDKDDNNKVLLN